MTPDEWQKIKRAFGHAIELDPAGRAAYLKQLRDDDRALHDVVERMLDEDSASDTLSQPVKSAAESFSRAAADRWVGHSFGNFRAVRRLASGGMSAVYLGARDDDQYDQDVAIKIVAGSFESEELYTRFKTERQILASLRHPYIAQLHDGGTTDDGTPYLVMEYVDGLPIDEYCNHHKLSINDRLALFGKVCEAVDFAHRNLVVHRDIKPSNILVAGDGTPKLLDFGIAKPLEEAVFSQTIARTREFARAMTPEFASPEQVRGETITTSTDVYSLGVLLYKILSGRMPYATRGSNVAAIAEAICETEPSRPSTVVTEVGSDGEAPEKVGAERATSVGKLRKLLAGDLDNIVMVTLQKDPARRYASARDLFDDIERYLALKPVEARADSVLYRMNRFVQRHRYGVAASVVILALLVGLPSYYSVQVAKQRDRAETEAAKSEQVADFMQSLFDASNPAIAQGATVSARELLDLGAGRIDTELADQPELRAAMQDVMGGAYLGLGLYEQSRPLLGDAFQTRTELHGLRHPDVLETYTKIAVLAIRTGDYPEAEQRHREALEISRAVHGERSAPSARIHSALGGILFEQGQIDEARVEFETALEILAAVSGDVALDRAKTMLGYGWLLTNDGEYEPAEVMLEEALAILSVTVDERHPQVQATLNQLAYVQMDIGEWDAAERTMRRSVELSKQVYGDEHPEVSGNLMTLATIVQNKGELDEAEQLLRQTLDTDRNMLGDEHPFIAQDKNNLASVLQDQGRYAEAEQLYRESLLLNRKVHGPAHPESLTSLSNLGLLLARAGNFDEATVHITEALEGRSSALGPEHPSTLASQYILADHLHRIGELDESLALFETVVEKRRQLLGERHPLLALTLTNYADLLRERGDLDTAWEAASLALEINRQAHGESHPTVARSLFVVAKIAAASGDDAQAARAFSTSLSGSRDYLPPDHPNLARALTAYGEQLVSMGEAESALPLLEEALAIRNAEIARGHWETGITLSVLGSCRSALALPGAETALEEGLRLLEQSRGAAYRETRRAAARLEAHRTRS